MAGKIREQKRNTRPMGQPLVGSYTMRMPPELVRQIREILIRLEALPESRRAWVIQRVKELLRGQNTTLH